MSGKRRWAVTIGVMTGMFIAALEATVVGTAMPTVISSLGGLNHYSWVFSAYLVTSTVTVPVWGKLSDLYGRRLLYQLGIAVFLIGTLLSGLSTSMTQLITFRAIQGLGAGALVPLGMTIIGDIFTLEERAKMQRRLGTFERRRSGRRRFYHRPDFVALGFLYQLAGRRDRRDHYRFFAQRAEIDRKTEG